MDWSPPGSSVHGIFLARILEWVAISSSRGSSWLGDWTHVSCISGGFVYCWATGEAHGGFHTCLLESILLALQSLALCWIIGKYSASPLEKEMATHSSTLAWKIPWTEEPGRLQSMESLRVGTTERLHFHFSLSCIGEGNGNPLQCSCLENPRDRGAWWAAVYEVAQSWTRLKWLSSSGSKSPIIDNGKSKLQPVSLKAIWHNESEALKLLT